MRRRRWVWAVVVAGSLALPGTALANSGDLSQPSGASGCMMQTPGSSGCASDSLDSGNELVGASAVTEFGGYIYVASGAGITVLQETMSGLSAVQCINSGGTGGCDAASELTHSVPSIVVSPDGKFVYVGDGGDEVLVFSRNTLTGELTWGGLNTTGCVTDSGGNHSCEIAPDGAGGYIAMSPDGSSIYTTIGKSDNSALVEFSRNATTGALTEIGCVTDVGADSNPGCIHLPIVDPAGAVVSPDGTHAYIADDEGAVWMVNRNTSTGLLSAPDSTLNPSDFCIAESSLTDLCTTAARGLTDMQVGGGIAISPDANGSFVYVLGQSGEASAGLIAEFQSQPASGSLPAGRLAQMTGTNGCISSNGNDGEGSPSSCATGYGLNEAQGLAVSPDGQNVYEWGGYQHDGTVVALDVDGSSGAITEDPVSGGSEDDCYVATDATSPPDPDCTRVQGIDGVSGAAVDTGNGHVYVTGSEDAGVADLTRELPPARFTVSATVTNTGGGPGGNTITASDPNPTASCSGASCTVDAGDTVTLTGNVASGYRFGTWFGTGNPCEGSTSSTCTVSNVQSDATAEADFAHNNPPTVSSYSITSLSHTSEQLTAKVFGDGLTTSYEIEYGTSTAYGKTVSGGGYSGDGSTTVSFTLTGLTSGTIYQFEVVATNSAGSGNGGNGTFTTSGAAPPSPPSLAQVSGVLTSPTAAKVTAIVKAIPYQHQLVQGYVEYATDKAYRLRTSKRDADPYTDKTFHSPPLALSTSSASLNPQLIGTLTGLTPGTVYDYRADVSARVGGTAYSDNGQFATPPPGPTATTGAASSVTASGATLSGTLDDKGALSSYAFDWSATYPGGCSGAPITGELPGRVSGINGPQNVSQALTQPLPAGSTVAYRLELTTKYDGFNIDLLGNPQTFTTGYVPDTGDVGGSQVLGADSAEIAAVIPGFDEQPVPNAGESILTTGNASDGGIRLTGTGTPEWGLFQYSSANPLASAYTSYAANIGTACNTYVETTLTGLRAGTVYGFTPVQAYGLEKCPGPSSYPADYSGGPIYSNVDQIGNWDSCWGSPSNILETYLNGGFGEINSGSTQYYPYPPVDPTSIGPYLTAPTGQTWGQPMLGGNAFFATAATTSPTSTTANQTGVSDGLGCVTPSNCTGNQTALAVQSNAGAAVDARARTKTIVLGTAKFSIAPHHRKTIHIRLTKAGQRFLKAHPRLASLLLVTVEKLRSGEKVTLRTTVLLRQPKPRPKRRR